MCSDIICSRIVRILHVSTKMMEETDTVKQRTSKMNHQLIEVFLALEQQIKAWLRHFSKYAKIMETRKEIMERFNNGFSGSTVMGKTVSASAAANVSFSHGIAYDVYGNVAEYKSLSIGGGTPSASLSGFVARSEESWYNNLNGMSGQVGASVDVGAVIGVDYCYSETCTQQTSFSLGIGAPIIAEAHGCLSYTWIDWKFNVFDIFR